MCKRSKIESQHGTWFYNVTSLKFPTLKLHGNEAVWYVWVWALTKPGATFDVIGFNNNIVDVRRGIWDRGVCADEKNKVTSTTCHCGVDGANGAPNMW